MSSRVVMVNDLLAFIDGAKQWLENQLADGAGTKTTTFGTSAGAADGSDRASVDATTSPHSAGTTASGAGSVAVAVEALRVALSQDMEICGDRNLDPGSMRLKIRRAIRTLLALDVPGRIARAESDAAKLRELLAAAEHSAKVHKIHFDLMSANAARAHEALRVEREACEKKDDTIEGLIGSIRHALPLISGIGRSGEALFMLHRIVKEYDTRRAAEKNNENNGGDLAGVHAQPTGTGVAPSPTNNAPVHVTDEDRREAAIAVWGRLNQSMRGQAVEDVARLIAKVRHERDGVVRELVEGLRKFIAPNRAIAKAEDATQPFIDVGRYGNYYGFTVGDLRNADALVNKHGGTA